MNYAFPADMTLDEVRAAVADANVMLGMRAFIEADRGDHVIFNYLVALDGSFPPVGGPAARHAAILRECRGLVMSKASGRVLARRLHKFFNVNERAETQAATIDWAAPHVVLEKLDGSMITPFRTDSGARLWGTKLGATPAAALASAYAEAHAPTRALADAAEAEEMTPVFEWCSPRQRIVLPYAEDRLALIAVRDNRTGAYLPFAQMAALAEAHGAPVVGSVGARIDDPAAFIAQTGGLEGAEGYVVRFDDGHMLKLKGLWYVRIHGLKEQLQQEKNAWSLVLSGPLDDARAYLDAEDRDRLDRFAGELERRLFVTARRLGSTVEAARGRLGGDKKRFALDVVNTPGTAQRERPLLFQIWDGADPVAAVRAAVAKNLATAAQVEDVRALAGGIRWDDFRDASFLSDS